MMKHRVYEIDIIIRRTIVYGPTTGGIAATFFAGIALVALFQPFRRRAQDVVDRRFDRSRYNAARTEDAFADGLRDEGNVDTLRANLLGSVQQTMAPAHTSLWLRERTK